MNATPVINNLYEAKALLKMTRGEKFDELKTFSTIANVLAMHEKLMLHGIRYRPNYKIAIATFQLSNQIDALTLHLFDRKSSKL